MRYFLLAFVFLLNSCASHDLATKKSSTDPVRELNRPGLTAGYEARALTLTNQYRRKNGLPPLHRDPRPQKAARKHSRDMAEAGLVTHAGSESSIRNSVKRARAENVVFSVLAENVAGPNLATGGINHLNHTPKRTVRRFMESPKHRKNILTPEFRFIGIGYYEGYWTQMLTAPARGAVYHH